MAEKNIQQNKGENSGQISEQEFEKREKRRKRRIRNQILSYVTLVVFIAILVTGGIFGGRYLVKLQAERKAQQVINETQEMEQEEPEVQENIVISEPEIPVVETMTEEEKLDEIVNAAIEVMPIEDKVAGLFFVTPESITGVSTAVKAGDGTKQALTDYAVGGIVYFAKNIQDQEQITEMITNTVNWSKYPIFIGVDEEGGSVSRIAKSSVEVTAVDSAEKIAATGDTEQAYQAGKTIAEYMKNLGFNVDFAPVADINNADGGGVLGDRSFGSDASLVSGYVTAMIRGIEENGTSSCIKHFPGIGDTTEDTHEGKASTDRTKEEFLAADATIYQAAIAEGVNMIMVSHVSAPGIAGDETPCSLSKTAVTDILRGELGYNGIIITDAMNMGAITTYYGADEAAIMALRAGCDMILMPEDFELAYQGILDAVNEGTISEERINDALRRIYRVKYADKIEG